jgi:hypothetical protein
MLHNSKKCCYGVLERRKKIWVIFALLNNTKLLSEYYFFKLVTFENLIGSVICQNFQTYSFFDRATS